MREVDYDACGGTRLRPEVLTVHTDGKNTDDVCQLSTDEAKKFADTVEFDSRQAKVAEQVLKEIKACLEFLVDVDLMYLSPPHDAFTLFGGEAQHIRLATQIGAGLTNIPYVLDELSIGFY